MSPLTEIRVERLLGRLLVDAQGTAFGRIAEVEAEPRGDAYVVTAVLVGPEGRLARTLAFLHQLPTLRAVGIGRKPRVRRVPWSWLDLTDPAHPRLRRKVPA
jgi:hypothetical protein